MKKESFVCRGGEIYACLLVLVNMLIERNKELGDALDFLPIIKRAKEYSTIKLCSFRGAGHTTAIAKLIEEKFDKVIVVFPNMNIANIFLKNNPKIKEKVIICSFDNLERLSGLIGYQSVIIDCSSLISQSKIDEIYQKTCFGTQMPLYIFME